MEQPRDQTSLFDVTTHWEGTSNNSGALRGRWTQSHMTITWRAKYMYNNNYYLYMAVQVWAQCSWRAIASFLKGYVCICLCGWTRILIKAHLSLMVTCPEAALPRSIITSSSLLSLSNKFPGYRQKKKNQVRHSLPSKSRVPWCLCVLGRPGHLCGGRAGLDKLRERDLKFALRGFSVRETRLLLSRLPVSHAKAQGTKYIIYTTGEKRFWSRGIILREVRIW